MRAVDTEEITAVALMSTDVERIFHGIQVSHEVWGSLLDIAVAGWLLGRQLFLACLAPVILVVGKLNLIAELDFELRLFPFI
jgi:ATP-binding cassette subfamily C (CFTR/MRP) protein 1